MSSKADERYRLFEVYGIEIEYMIVDRKTLMPLFICDQVLARLGGEKTNLVTDGMVAWSNELALHVIELKCNGPQRDLDAMEQQMWRAIRKVNQVLEGFNAQLLPTAMHPFFNPNDGSLKLWPDENVEIYGAYDRIFGCRGHGWGNLQSIHINLPFGDDHEFFRLHSAIRLLLPLLPALAASSPYLEGRRGPLLDTRLHYYLENQRRIPSILGQALPEPVQSQREYQQVILEPMYRDIAPLDPEGLLQHEWLNSRLAIARFERNAIEIRILDSQESPAQDFALIKGVVRALRRLVDMNQATEQCTVTQESLRETLYGALNEGLAYSIRDDRYLQLLGAPAETIGAVCQGLLGDQTHWDFLLRNGSLGERLVRALGTMPNPEAVRTQYRLLGACLHENSRFE